MSLNCSNKFLNKNRIIYIIKHTSCCTTSCTSTRLGGKASGILSKAKKNILFGEFHHAEQCISISGK